METKETKMSTKAEFAATAKMPLSAQRETVKSGGNARPEIAVPAKVTVFRAADAPLLSDVGCMEWEELTPLMSDSLERLSAEGLGEGEHVQVLFNVPGFSLVYVWAKRDYPLPLHSHDSNCLYYIIAGSVRLGTQSLGRGDGFFLPSETPYSYKVGPEGVEMLEFRNTTHFNVKLMANNPRFWEKAIETVRREAPGWKSAKAPHLLEITAKEVLGSDATSQN